MEHVKAVKTRCVIPENKQLVCPACGSGRSRVRDIRNQPRAVRDQLTWPGDGRWRRRECLECHRTYTSNETVTALDPKDVNR